MAVCMVVRAFCTVSLPNPSRLDAFGAIDVNGVLYAAMPHGTATKDEAAGPLTAAGTAAGTQAGGRSVLATCVAEAAQTTGALDRLWQRTFAVAQVATPMQVLDVSSDWATRAGAGTHLSTGVRRQTSAWATAIATRWPDLHGVAYIAATRPSGRALALWSPRCVPHVASAVLLLRRTLDDPVLSGALAWAAHVTGTTLLTEPGR